MKIGELARLTGIASSAIRFYEDKGLLPQIARGRNGYRDYGERDLERLRLIGMAKLLGFGLDEMRAAFSDDGLSKPEVLRFLGQRMDDLEHMLARLREQHAQLATLKAMLEQSWAQGDCVKLDVCPPFR
jgi:MerR family copper efflux transcriptional regulator